ncbi:MULTISPECIES: DUF4623 domain-containing protein [Prevotellaceae]|uniref:DUF4623 domain-containing protein n=1 Tax=Prevotellaceae TaxID=171552 RepID=UPI0003D331F1|nr:DUF4623 domain-containing protein [Prevotella phocaeensis]ETD17592.1 hypothetical protein HMPREF1199_01843 [Hoylesella oralis CC98A]
MYKFKYIAMVVAVLGCCAASCGDNYPESQDEPYATDLLSIKIVNAGAAGNETVEGKIDEENKMIDFPRLDIATNFSALKIEAKVSEGASLQQTEYNFSMDEEDTYKTLLLRVTNHNRYKDYFIKVRKRIPVYGADFKNVTVYNFSGDNLYPDYTALSTRCADFDGNYVLVVTRSATKPHLLKVSDLKEGKSLPISLDLTGVSGGTFPYNMGALANGHVYMASLSGSKASPLKIYYWETPESQPETIANINIATIDGAGARHGDNMSLNIDKNGNGYIFFGDNASAEILRLTVTAHKTVSDPIALPSVSGATACMGIYRIEETSQYVFSGVRTPVMLTDESASVKYTMGKDHTAAEGISPRIFTFNKSRYLIVCTAGLGSASKATPALYIYDISKGNTVEEALAKFDEAGNYNPIYSFILGGAGNGAPMAQTNYYVERDADGNDVKLYVFASRANSGFVICEFPIAKEED